MVRRSKAIEKYDKSSKLVNIVKKCKIMDLNDEAILNTIEFETGKTVDKDQLADLVEIARREMREQQIEVDVHMEYMIKIGLYADAMNHQEMLTTIEKIIYGMIIDEGRKPAPEKNRNIILAMANTLTKVFDTKDKTATNIAFLTKTKAIWEQGLEQDLFKSSSSTEKTEPKAAIMIKDQKQDVEKLIDQVIDARELENNRVA